MAITTIPSSGTTDGTNLVLLNTTSISSATANVAFNNTLITSTYDNYMLVASNVLPSNDSVNAELKFSSDNGSNFKNVDTGRQFNRLDADNSGHEFDNSSAHISLAPSLGNDTGRGGSFRVYFNNLNNTTHNKTGQFEITFRNVNESYNWKGGYEVESTDAINFVRFQFNSGNIASGDFSFYGVRT